MDHLPNRVRERQPSIRRAVPTTSSGGLQQGATHIPQSRLMTLPLRPLLVDRAVMPGFASISPPLPPPMPSSTRVSAPLPSFPILRSEVQPRGSFSFDMPRWSAQQTQIQQPVLHHPPTSQSVQARTNWAPTTNQHSPHLLPAPADTRNVSIDSDDYTTSAFLSPDPSSPEPSFSEYIEDASLPSRQAICGILRARHRPMQ
jgi:hypothetical protein